MDGLSRLGFEAAVEDGEVGSEVGYRLPVGVFVVDGQTSSHVQVAQDDSALAEPGADRVDPFAQVLEHLHASDLRSDVKVQTDDFQMAQSLQRGGLVMTTGGHPPPEYAQKSLYVQQPSLRAGVFMVHKHYGTQTVNRGAVMPGMLVKHKDGTWTASANLRGRLYLHRGIERTYTRDLLVEVFLDGRGNGLNH